MQLFVWGKVDCTHTVPSCIALSHFCQYLRPTPCLECSKTNWLYRPPEKVNSPQNRHRKKRRYMACLTLKTGKQSLEMGRIAHLLCPRSLTNQSHVPSPHYHYFPNSTAKLSIPTPLLTLYWLLPHA